MQFIAANLTRPLTVADVARAVHLSEFHLHRVFHDAVGESVGRFVTRRRLETAALRIAYEPHEPITRIALDSGYSSSANFSKAFRAYFGCSPSQLREPTGATALGKLQSQYHKAFDPSSLYAVPHALDEDAVVTEAARWRERVRYEDSDGHTFACLASAEGYTFDALAATWAELIDRARALALCEDDVDAWGISHDSPDLTASDRCRYHACVPCAPHADLPAPLFRGAMAAGRYAVFTYAGPVDAVGDAYRSIYSCWFRDSSLVPADFVPIDHYVHDEPRDGRVEMELWIRVRPKTAA